MAVSKPASFKFYYDVVCPFAYMASTLVQDVSERAGVPVVWTPVLLAGLYENTLAAQGRTGSATDVMAPAKLKIFGQDMLRQMVRRGVQYKEPNMHPQKTVNAMRLLSAIADHGTRVAVSKSLYQAYWTQQQDVTDMAVLQQAVAPFGLAASDLLSQDSASSVLRANTREASAHGAFGVPGFLVGQQFFWGTDRLFLVERALGLDSHPERLQLPPSQGARKLTFFFDYSSPWSYVAMERLQGMLDSVKPVQVTVEWVPILLGALFKEIGTPNVPMAAMNPTKRAYISKDLTDWCDYGGVTLSWPSHFPLRTVLPLRVTLAAHCDSALILHLFRAAWQSDRDIGDPEVLAKVLEEGPCAGQVRVEDTQSELVKGQLFTNTRRALDEGVCGVPTFQVDNGPVIFGQDKLNVVADILCGWQNHTLIAKL